MQFPGKSSFLSTLSNMLLTLFPSGAQKEEIFKSLGMVIPNQEGQSRWILFSALFSQEAARRRLESNLPQSDAENGLSAIQRNGQTRKWAAVAHSQRY